MFNIGLVSISLAASVCILNCHFRGHRNSQVPKFFKKLLLIDSNKNKNLKDLLAQDKFHDLNRNSDKKIEIIIENSDALNSMQISIQSNKLFKKPNFNLKELDCFKTIKTKEHNFEKLAKVLKKYFYALESKNLKSKENNLIYDEWKEVASRVDYIFFLLSSFVVFFAPFILFGKFYFRDISKSFANNEICTCESNF